jgi:hypothetical protein
MFNGRNSFSSSSRGFPWIVVLVALYWIIRSAVRDGITDAQRRRRAAETRSTPWK